MRNCGKCTLCCYFLPVSEYDSEEYKYCSNCTPKMGCMVYETRREVCKSFGCLWWHELSMPESLRPDKCGVMFEVPYGTKTYIAYVDPEKINSWRSKSIQGLIRKIVRTNHPVVVVHKKERTVYTTKTMGMEDVKREVMR